ncbi:MAG TPA: hypothetical protein VGF15_05370 [Solirubrobacteraceae bacterium]
MQHRLGELRPLVSEYEQLLAAERSLKDMKGALATPARATKTQAKPGARVRRGSAAGALQRAASKPSGKRQPTATGTVGQAVLDALEHGSHTVSELVMVTAMRAGEIRGSVRHLLSRDEIVKVDRAGRTAYARRP